MFSNDAIKKIIYMGEQLHDSPHSFIKNIFDIVRYDVLNMEISEKQQNLINKINKIQEDFNITFKELY